VLIALLELETLIVQHGGNEGMRFNLQIPFYLFFVFLQRFHYLSLYFHGCGRELIHVNSCQSTLCRLHGRCGDTRFAGGGNPLLMLAYYCIANSISNSYAAVRVVCCTPSPPPRGFEARIHNIDYPCTSINDASCH